MNCKKIKENISLRNYGVCFNVTTDFWVSFFDWEHSKRWSVTEFLRDFSPLLVFFNEEKKYHEKRTSYISTVWNCEVEMLTGNRQTVRRATLDTEKLELGYRRSTDHRPIAVLYLDGDSSMQTLLSSMDFGRHDPLTGGPAECTRTVCTGLLSVASTAHNCCGRTPYSEWHHAQLRERGPAAYA